MADDPTKSDEIKKVVEDTILKVKVDQLDRSVGHVVSTARLGYGFFAFFLTITGILAAILFGTIARMSDSLEVLSTASNQSNVTIERLENEIRGLRASLGDTPVELREVSAVFQTLTSQLDERVARLEEAEVALSTLGEDIVMIREILFGPKATIYEDIEAINLNVRRLAEELLSVDSDTPGTQQ